jgi:hypothetical protein
MSSLRGVTSKIGTIAEEGDRGGKHRGSRQEERVERPPHPVRDRPGNSSDSSVLPEIGPTARRFQG